ncbi:MAG: class I SAM-dependent methyltransferase family protein [Candidatus Bathyarchaeia archaeon]
MPKRLKEALLKFLSPDEAAHVYNSYDVVGDIAILRLTEKSEKQGNIIAKTVMDIHKNVKTVLAQTSPVHGEFRLRKLKYIAGENKTVTVHRESGCLFSVDVEKCYFSPRLFYERLRIARLVKAGEVVVNMFAGVGCFSIIIAKHSQASKVYSIDINPVAIQFMEKNVRLNRVFGRVIPLFGDAKEVVKEKLCGKADRVLMPLPEKAYEYLPYAVLAIKKPEGQIHYYEFEHAKKGEDPISKVKEKAIKRLSHLGVAFEIPFGRVVRTTGPNWHQVVLDIHIHK